MRIVTATGTVVALAALRLQPGFALSLFSAPYPLVSFRYLSRSGPLWADFLADWEMGASCAIVTGAFFLFVWRLRKLPAGYPSLLISVGLALVTLLPGVLAGLERVSPWGAGQPAAASFRIVCASASLAAAMLLAWAPASLAHRISQVVEDLSHAERERNEARAALEAAEARMTLQSEFQGEIDAVNLRLEHILDSTNDGIIKVDSTWTILYGNRKALQMLPDLRIQRTFWSSFPELLGSHAEAVLRSSMDDRRATQFEIFYRPYAEWFSVSIYPTPAGISLFFVKTTEQKNLERMVEGARKTREERLEALGLMAMGIAHELNNPLAIIHGTACDLLEQSRGGHHVPSREVCDAAQVLLKTSERIVRILKGLRTLARDSAQDPMETASVQTIVDEAVQMQNQRLSRYWIALEWPGAAGLPMILCREAQIVQILTNLLNNAVDAIVDHPCEHRWIKIEAALADGQIRIDVSDSGHEMTPEVRKRVMELFFTTKANGVGMGVGLSLSQAIAKEHGGSLVLREPAVPTCFRLTLPPAATSSPHETP